MTLLIDTLSIIHLLQNLTTSVENDINNQQTDQLSPERKQQSLLTYESSSGDLIVLWLGRTESSLRSALIEYLIPQDITLILCSTKEQLWSWLNKYPSLTVACLIIETNNYTEDIVRQSSTYPSIRSILIRCFPNELLNLQRLLRSYAKVDGIFADDKRSLIKLVIDLALYCEEIADLHAENENNQAYVRRNYDRALSLCTLAKRL